MHTRSSVMMLVRDCVVANICLLCCLLQELDVRGFQSWCLVNVDGSSMIDKENVQMPHQNIKSRISQKLNFKQLKPSTVKLQRAMYSLFYPSLLYLSFIVYVVLFPYLVFSSLSCVLFSLLISASLIILQIALLASSCCANVC